MAIGKVGWAGVCGVTPGPAARPKSFPSGDAAFPSPTTTGSSLDPGVSEILRRLFIARTAESSGAKGLGVLPLLPIFRQFFPLSQKSLKFRHFRHILP